MTDVREILFRDIAEKKYRAVLVAERSGVLAGVKAAMTCAEELGIEIEMCKSEGDELSHGQVFCNIKGTPMQIATAEEKLIGTLAKASGIATAARDATIIADGKIRIVCGAWKKMPPETKFIVRNAVAAGGAVFRICEPPMVYMDKNFIRMLGSVAQALKAAEPIKGATKIVQLKGISSSIEEETVQAVDGGANILMVDTGRKEDLLACLNKLKELGCRDSVEVAFAGSIHITEIPEYAELGVNAIDIGKAIIDAPLLDMRLDVLQEEM